MCLILQEIDIKVEKINGTSYADVEPDESPAKRSGGGTAGSPTSPYRQPLETIPDQEYVRSMEERYGIGEEGIF
jgi:hypothetical protein